MAVEVLLHFDGTNGSTSFVDSSGNNHTVTVAGTAALTTTGQTFGTACANVPIDGKFSLTGLPTLASASTFRFRLTTGASLDGNAYVLIASRSSTGFVLYRVGTALHLYSYSAGLISSGGSFALSVSTQYAISVECVASDVWILYVNGTKICEVAGYAATGATNIKFNEFLDSAFKVDELLFDNGQAWAGGAATYTVETTAFTTPVIAAVAISAYDWSLYSLSNDFDALVSVDWALLWRGIETIAADWLLPSAVVGVTAIDWLLKSVVHAQAITIVDWRLLSNVEADYQSVIIDVHSPEVPVVIYDINNEPSTLPLNDYYIYADSPAYDFPPTVIYDDSNQFVHFQPMPSAVWTINHNLNRIPTITVLDSAQSEVEGDYSFPDHNTAILTFSAPFSGAAYFD